jgi:hypothetical protein
MYFMLCSWISLANLSSKLSIPFAGLQHMQQCQVYSFSSIFVPSLLNSSSKILQKNCRKSNKCELFYLSDKDLFCLAVDRLGKQSRGSCPWRLCWKSQPELLMKPDFEKLELHPGKNGTLCYH